MSITYRNDRRPTTEQIIELYKSAGLNRPVDDAERIGMMYQNSNLIVTAWKSFELVGIARSLTDFCYCCYLSDLAVAKDYQKQGIGKALIDLTRELITDRCMLLLLSAPGAMEYYPHTGFDKVENGFIIKRAG